MPMRPIPSPPAMTQETMNVTDPETGCCVLARRWPPKPPANHAPRARSVLYVHGATFPSALSVGFPFENRSWADDLASRGLDVWAFDFVGFGASGRYPAHGAGPAPGRAPQAVSQIGAVIDAVLRTTGAGSVSLLAHSWGTIPAGLFAARHPKRVDRLAFFAPIVDRSDPAGPFPTDPFRDVTLAWQAERFRSEIPVGKGPAFVPDHWDSWAAAYLETDPDSLQRVPPAVRVPAGPFADIQAAHAGTLAYDPAALRSPLLIVRGEWDTLCTEADASHLRAQATGAPSCDVVTLSAGTHVMHLETGRHRLYDPVGRFLVSH